MASHAMNFLEIKLTFEQLIADPFELLELHYTPYSFGSGFCAYRIKGKNILFIYSGKDNTVEILVSEKHENYPSKSWSKIYEGSLTNGLGKMSEAIESFSKK